MVALQMDRTRFRWIRVNGTPCRALYRLIVNYLYTVENNRHMAVHQSKVVSLPLSRLLTGIYRWSNSSENGTDTLQALHTAIPIHNLSLIHPPQIDSAIATALY